jgi:hypothetical protein
MSTRWSADQVTSVDGARRHLVTARPFEVKETLPASLAEKVSPGQLLSAMTDCQTLLLTPHRYLRQMPLHAARISDAAGSRWLRSNASTSPTHPGLTFSSENSFFKYTEGAAHGRERTTSPVSWQTCRWNCKSCKDMEIFWPVRFLHLLTQHSRLDKNAPLSSWPQFDVIHLACHVFVPQRPLDAALLLGSDKLRATEFFLPRSTQG